MAKEWTEAEERALRYRVNVSTTSKGVKSWDTTCEGLGYTIAEILERSDELVRQLELRYGPSTQEVQSELEKRYPAPKESTT